MTKTKIINIKRVSSVSAYTLPNGEYEGTWGGYEIKVDIDGIEYTLATNVGIRTPSAPCVVHIQDGSIYAEVG